MWILFAVGSAFFAGATSVLAKAGIKSVSSDFATAFRTGMVLIFSWLMVFVVGCQNAVSTITPRALVFLALSGAATGLSWLCYFKALSIGNLSKVVVLVFAWAIVLVKKEGGDWKKMTRRDAVLLVLSGITTGASWLCYYRALQTGRASVVVPIDKCSMLFAVALSAIFLKEKQTRRSLLALALVVAGTFMIALA